MTCRSLTIALLIVGLCAALLPSTALAGDRESAKRMHDRLVGIPPSPTVLDDMTTLIGDANAEGAAQLAMQNSYFYSSTLKSFITPWTNESQTVFAPLNDYTATVIGIIRDDKPFTEVLTGDYVYIGRGGASGSGAQVVSNRYSQSDNVHYEQLEDQLVDLSDRALFISWPQENLPAAEIVSSEAAGVITTRAAGEAFFSAGTNRRMWRYTAMNYLCSDMEALNDISRPVDRIRQDVPRSPGSDSEIFRNSCSGCHSGMDPMAGAYAYFEWAPAGQRVRYTRGRVQPKMLINSGSFPFGYETIDNRWDNYWREGPNAAYGWDDTLPGGGYGVKSLGEEVASSRGFSRCQVQKVFKQVCFREPVDEDERLVVEDITDDFEDFGYNLRTVFAKVAAYCRED
jgi:hypothetical protein